ncbi:MAG: PIN domain-containing protein [Chitinophagales bacterium]
MNEFLADTNFLIYLLKGNRSTEPYLSSLLHVSIISEIELLGMPGITETEILAAKNLLSDCHLMELNSEIKDYAIELKRKYRMKTADAIIAATAKYFSVPILTADKAFRKITEIDTVIMNPR